MLDVEKLIAGVHEYIARALSPLNAQTKAQQQEIAELRTQLAETMEALRQQQDETAAINKALAEIPAPTPGPVTVDDVRPALLDELRKAVAALPVPQDGKSVTVADVEPLLAQWHAAWELDFERRAQGVLERAVDRMPKPRDGRDGIDGLGFDDVTMEFDGERALAVVFQRGEQVKRFEITLPTIIDRGVYRPDAGYVKHDGVTFGGSFWIAQKDQPGKPGEGNDGWRLAVKRGRDGRDVTREGGK
jgi:hypothetical protein